ncbi:hypothetical protein GCM10011309_10490 [Litorimonas cladophorae]|uniref:Uncharacterized protein n=1 Tax=Litorimonas cladophorae TaxID=1220491 RepID=A0A918KGA6_9PROT|nr:hypothetical protein [Litorimonas cladophorae]GGX62420.1 hypothetical protein GCM10011309_10490 [Litorimonas cladophorae]
MARPYRHKRSAEFLTTSSDTSPSVESLAFDFEDADTDEIEIRQAWRILVERTLPDAADLHQGWPVYRNHCFGRILLDNAVGQFWRDVIKPPAWKNTPLPVLQTAIDLGEGILNGDVDIWALNDASLLMRGKPLHGKVAAKRTRRKQARFTSKKGTKSR